MDHPAARHLHSLSLLALVLATLPVPGPRGDGLIYIPDARRILPHPRPLPQVWPVRPNFPLQVTRHRVQVEIDETAARTRVEESFHNPNDVQLEGIYIFPLPPGAAVSGFTMKMGGKEVSGEILERGRARELYEQIVRQVRDPGLLEYVDRGLFKASVFPIPARGAIDVAIEYSEALARDHGATTYRYPLDTGKYATGPYRDVLIDVRLRSSAPLRSIQCPSHEGVGIARVGEREARLTLEAKELRADKDLVVSWNVSEDALAPVVIAHRGSEPDGFFFLTLSPRAERPRTPVAKDVVFVIDTSGSMLGPKMEQVKKALRYCITGLSSVDRFNIIPFSTEARRFREGLAEASEEQKRLAGVFIDEMKASGGTNLEEGLRFGLADLGSPERLQMVVLLSDGEPTIGTIAPADIIARVKEKNAQRRRVFIFGVGEDLNAKLLDQLAKETAGATQYIRSSESIEVPLSSFFDKIDSPVLTDVRVEFPSGGVTDLYPRPLPDLFRGEQLELLGRFTSDGPRTVVVRGKLQGEERVFEYSLPFAGGQNGYVARLWAVRKVGYLLEQMRLAGESKEVKDEVVRLSKLYGIVTPYTSYLILEEDRLAWQRAPESRDLRSRFAVSEALGVPADAAAGAAPAPLAESTARAAQGFRADKGEGAIELSRDIDGLKRGGAAGGGLAKSFVERVVNRAGERFKQIDDRSFYLQGERWIDAAITAGQAPAGGPERRVKYLSDEYFQLLRDEPGIGKLLSVGENVTFVWKGKVIAIEA